jgi:TPR repeat protein
MVALRGLTRSTMVIAVLIAAQSTQAGAASSGGFAQDSGRSATTTAGKHPAVDIRSARAAPTAYQHQSALSHELDPSQSGTAIFDDRGFAKIAPQRGLALSRQQKVCQNVQATTGAPIARQTGPSDLAYLERARALVKSNDIAAARLIFTRLANNGVAEAAFELGRTYDPEFLKTIPIAGLEPDREVAWQWYKRAAALGNADAKSRLAKLKIDTQQ